VFAELHQVAASRSQRPPRFDIGFGIGFSNDRRCRNGEVSGSVANVQIDPDFASVMDHKWYYVFLTPMGDTRGLYVSVKTPTAFQVRENERGRSNVEFDYRIVAHPLDSNGERLPAAPVIRTPKPPILPRR
jgi:hypothetical protein